MPSRWHSPVHLALTVLVGATAVAFLVGVWVVAIRGKTATGWYAFEIGLAIALVSVAPLVLGRGDKNTGQLALGALLLLLATLILWLGGR